MQFTVDGNRLATSAEFDFETKSSYSVRLRATDRGGLGVERTFTIGVADVAESFVVEASDWTAAGLTLVLDGDAVCYTMPITKT